jgi:hypothetical protein
MFKARNMKIEPLDTRWVGQDPSTRNMHSPINQQPDVAIDHTVEASPKVRVVVFSSTTCANPATLTPMHSSQQSVCEAFESGKKRKEGARGMDSASAPTEALAGMDANSLSLGVFELWHLLSKSTGRTSEVALTSSSSTAPQS